MLLIIFQKRKPSVWLKYSQGLLSCYLLRKPVLKGGLNNYWVGKAPVRSPGGVGVLVTIVEKENEKEASIGGEGLGGGK